MLVFLLLTVQNILLQLNFNKEIVQNKEKKKS